MLDVVLKQAAAWVLTPGISAVQHGEAAVQTYPAVRNCFYESHLAPLASCADSYLTGLIRRLVSISLTCHTPFILFIISVLLTDDLYVSSLRFHV